MVIHRSRRCICGYMCGWVDDIQVISCGCPINGKQMKTPEQLLVEAASIMKDKREDYTEATGTIHQNFERCEQVINWFLNDIDKVYVTLITVKLARLAVLLSTTGKVPNNESIEDSFKDLINYCALWASKRS